MVIFVSFSNLLSHLKHKKRIKDYSKFINEKEIIRKRAINKYNSENKAKIQKMEEYDQLMAELEEVNRM